MNIETEVRCCRLAWKYTPDHFATFSFLTHLPNRGTGNNPTGRTSRDAKPPVALASSADE